MLVIYRELKLIDFLALPAIFGFGLSSDLSVFGDAICVFIPLSNRLMS